MSKIMTEADFLELLSDNMIVIGAGEKRFEIHEKLLKSVTKYFESSNYVNKDTGRMEFLCLGGEIEKFQMFFAWLYSINRRHQLKDKNVDALLSLYSLGSVWQVQALHYDVMYTFLGNPNTGNQFASKMIKGLNLSFVRQQQGKQYHFSILYDNLAEVLNDVSFRIDITLFIELYISSVSWGVKIIKDKIFDIIQSKLNEQNEFFTFDQVKMLFDQTKELGFATPLNKLCLALTHYQRSWVSSTSEEKDSPDDLGAAEMQRRFKEIEGFMIAYLNYEEEWRGMFDGLSELDPRKRCPSWGQCYFHSHKDGQFCRRISE